MAALPRRSLRLTLLGVLVFTFVGLPNISAYYLKSDVFSSLDLLSWAERVVLAEEGMSDGDTSTSSGEHSEGSTDGGSDSEMWNDESSESSSSSWTDDGSWSDDDQSDESGETWAEETWTDDSSWQEYEHECEDEECFEEEGYFYQDGTYYNETGYCDDSGNCQEFNQDDYGTYDENYEEYKDEYYEASEYEHFQEQGENMVGDIEHMMEMLGHISTFLSKLSATNPSDQTVVNAIETLQVLVGQGLDKMEDLQELLENGDVTDPEEMQAFMEGMDGIRTAAESAMQVIMKWVTENPEVMSTLTEEEQKAVFEAEFEDDIENDADMEEYFEENYSGITSDFSTLMNNVDPSAAKDIVKNVSEAVMKELLNHMDESSAKKILTTILNSMGALGDKGSELLQNTTDVLNTVEAVDIDASKTSLLSEQPELSDELSALSQLQEQSGSTLISADTEDEFKMQWSEVNTLLVEGGSEAEFKAKVEALKNLLEENIEALIFEDKVAFNDVMPEDNAWYYSDVMEARQDGIIDGHENGDFKPGDNVTNAEFVKMILESKGENVGSSESGNWYDNYVEVATQEYGIQSPEDWNDQADRETVAEWTCQVYDLGTGTACTESLNENGIFNAPDSGTGIERPDEPINRAEVVKVVETTDEVIITPEEMEQTLEEITVSPAPTTEKLEFGLWDLLSNFFSSVLSY